MWEPGVFGGFFCNTDTMQWEEMPKKEEEFSDGA